MDPAVTRLQESQRTADPTSTPPQQTSPAREAFNDPDSLSSRMEKVHRAFEKAYPSAEDGPFNFIEEVYEDRILARVNEQTMRIPYELTDQGVVWGQAEEVKVSLSVEPVSESEETDHFRTTLGGHILEALDAEGEGRVWRVTMVRPGISKNGRRYRPEVLREAMQLYEGARSFDGHRDPDARRRSSVAGMTGWHENIQIRPDGSLVSDFHIAESREDIRQLFLTAWKNQRPDLIGFSHDVSAITEAAMVDGRRISDVRKIVEVHSVDVVADPSAGGQIERLVASRQEEDSTMKLEEFLRRLRAGDLTEAELTEAYEANPEWKHIAEALEAERAAKAEENDGGGATQVQEGGEEPKADETKLSGTLKQLVVQAAAESHGLPQAATQRLEEAVKGANTEAEIFARVAETKSIWDAAMAARPSQLPGQGVEVGEEDADKLRKGLQAMINGDAEIDGVPAFRGIKEAYSAFTGRHPYESASEEDFNRRILAESVGAFASIEDARRLQESLTTASWAEALGDSIRRRLIAEYQANEYASWRQIVSDITNPPDFRTNRRVRIGGYDVLPTVAETGAYTALTSPTDEEATFAVTKKGGTEDYTLEMIANDDLGGLRRIPRNLGRAAALTLYRAIWNTTIAGNALIYDGNALFDDVNHSNDNSATPLDEAGVSVLRRRMIRQTQPGETSGFVGLMPRFLAVPPELYVTGFKLTESEQAVVGTAESATTPNFARNLNLLEIPTFTDINDWYLIADPNTVPTVEVGFYQGRQDPELLVQDQPAVGSVFTNDTFTWKIRHIWGLTVLDYRGFQRATNA